MMEIEYTNGEIVWAKLTGFPWWPAYILETPSPCLHKIIFFGDYSQAEVEASKLRRWADAPKHSPSDSRRKKLRLAMAEATETVLSPDSLLALPASVLPPCPPPPVVHASARNAQGCPPIFYVAPSTHQTIDPRTPSELLSPTLSMKKSPNPRGFFSEAQSFREVLEETTKSIFSSNSVGQEKFEELLGSKEWDKAWPDCSVGEIISKELEAERSSYNKFHSDQNLEAGSDKICYKIEGWDLARKVGLAVLKSWGIGEKECENCQSEKNSPAKSVGKKSSISTIASHTGERASFRVAKKIGKTLHERTGGKGVSKTLCSKFGEKYEKYLNERYQQTEDYKKKVLEFVYQTKDDYFREVQKRLNEEQHRINEIQFEFLFPEQLMATIHNF